MNTNKPTENEALRAAHVQNPAGIEHVAGDVSKNGAESNMTPWPAPSAAAALPEGWVPLVITHEGQYPEGVAYAKAPAAPAADATTVPEGWTDADADAARLALELECLLTDTKDQAVVSKWWTSANDALELHRARLAAPPQPAPVANRLLQLADELDEQLTSGSKWSPAQHACCSVSNALRAMLAEAPKPSPTPPADVLEDAARLDWLALAGPTSICLVIDRPHDGEVEVSTDDVTGYGKTLREALDAARKQGGAT